QFEEDLTPFAPACSDVDPREDARARVDAEPDAVRGLQILRKNRVPVVVDVAEIVEDRHTHVSKRRPPVFGVPPEGILVLEAELLDAADGIGAADVRDEINRHALAQGVVHEGKADTGGYDVRLRDDRHKLRRLDVKAPEVELFQSPIVPDAQRDLVVTTAARVSALVAIVDLGEER